MSHTRTRVSYLGQAVKAKVVVRRNLDGEIRIYPDFINFRGIDEWEFGSFACDCQAHLFFCHAAGEDESTDEDLCGGLQDSRSRYSIELRTKDDKVLYSDFHTIEVQRQPPRKGGGIFRRLF